MVISLYFQIKVVVLLNGIFLHILLYMWILWNKSDRKWLHTLLSWFILIFDKIFNDHSVVWWQIEVVVFFKLNLLTLIENSIKDFANSSISEWTKLTFQMITFFKQIILSLYFSCGFCETYQLVSVFILYLIVYENLACSF